MARPWRDKAGTYYLRQRTPRDLVGRLRGMELTLPVTEEEFTTVRVGDQVQASLRTRDPVTAKVRHARADAALRRLWAAHRSEPSTLTLKQAAALAGRYYWRLSTDYEEADDDRLGLLRDLTRQVLNDLRSIHPDLEAGLAEMARLQGEDALPQFGLAGQAIGRMLHELNDPEQAADRLLAEEGLVVNAASRTRLVDEIKAARTDAVRRLVRATEGDFRPDTAADRFPEWKPVAAALPRLTLTALFERWENHPENAEVAVRTKQAYGGAIKAAAAYLNDPDASSVSTDQLRQYFDARLAGEGGGMLSPRVARDVHKSALASVFRWGVDKGLLPSNPVEAVRIKVVAPRILRSKAATDAETAELVAKTLALPLSAEPGTVDAARRWCPFLLLYTGCRIGELTQLRAEDVLDAMGRYPMLRITPDAGTVKGRKVRLVPLHPRLVELGFLDFVTGARRPGPLFYDPEAPRRRADAKVLRGELVADDVATWCRSAGLGDPLLLRPLHALRHRFMTLARRSGMEEQYSEAIAGHSSERQNRAYGEYPAEVLHREIRRLRPEVVEGAARDGDQ